MNYIYACNRNLPHHSSSLSPSLFQSPLLLCFFAVTGWASKACRRTFITINTRLQLHPVGHGHNHSTDIDWLGGRKRVRACRGVTAVDSEREYVLVFLYLFISGFPCSFLCLHGSLSNADAENSRARAARTSHTTCLSLPLTPSLFLLLCYCMWQFEHNEVMRATAAAELRKIVISSNWSGAQSCSDSARACYENWQWLALFLMLMTTTATRISHVS